MDDLHYVLVRYSDDGQSTQGLLFRRLPNTALRWFCHTIEDERRAAKMPGETRIPAGIYELKLRKAMSRRTVEYRNRYPWFTWHVELQNVPNFTYVYVHVGNTDKDTDGCILLADSQGNNQVGEGFAGNSATAFKRWYQEIVPHLEAGGRAFLHVHDEDALAVAL